MGPSEWFRPLTLLLLCGGGTWVLVSGYGPCFMLRLDTHPPRPQDASFPGGVVGSRNVYLSQVIGQ